MSARARALVRAWVGIDGPAAGVRDSDAPCPDFEPGAPAGRLCETDGHHLCRECVHAPHAGQPDIPNDTDLEDEP